MHTERELRERIMRRVWGVYVMRQLASPVARVGVLVASILAVSASVSVKNVVENALGTSGVAGFANFSLSAMTHTTLFVQASVLLAGLIVLWFVVDTVRTLAFMRSMRTI